MYTIYVDGTNILGTDISSAILEPTVTLGLNKAGSAEFTMPPEHPFYDIPKVMKSNVEIHEIDKNGLDDVIFFGRISSITKDWFNRKHIVCEGALAFFNDSIQRYKKYGSKTTTCKNFFKALIDKHNEQMIDDERKFVFSDEDSVDLVGPDGEDITNKKIYRLTNYETTLDCLVNMCIDAEGGYLFTERDYTVDLDENQQVVAEHHFTKVYWKSSMLYSQATQPIQFGLNLLDIQEDFDIDEFYTALLPLGATDSETGKPKTIKSVNDNVDYIQNDTMVETYGFILKVKEWSDISKASKLKKKAQEWMASERFDRLMITCDAADLSVLDTTWDKFRVGAKVRVTSAPHGLDKVYPISEIIYHLESGKKEITIGTQERKTLTYITKKGEKEYRMPDAYYDEDPED